MIHGQMAPLENDYLEKVVSEALGEDLGPGDLTTESLVDPALVSSAHLIVGQEAVLAGLDIFCRVIRHLDPGAAFALYAQDGDVVAAGKVILEVTGRTEALFKAERTALNFLQHLSGVATRTRRFLKLIEGFPVTLLDTRKTTPLLRPLEKYAVRVAGGGNHRFGLFDGILIKDNHRKVIGDLATAIAELKRLFPMRPVQVECATLDEVREALAAGSDLLLLDNMSPPVLREAVELVGGRCPLEASGGVDESTLREVAATGVEYISAGTIIHGATFVDMSLEVTG